MAPGASLGPALVVLASLGIAEAAPPAGKPVFIHVQGLAPTSVGQNGFVVAGDFTEGGAFQWMPTSGVTLVGGGSAYISRDGKAMVGAVLDQNSKQQAARWEGGRSWRMLGPLVPGAVPCDSSFELCDGDEWRRQRGGGRGLLRHQPGQRVRLLYGVPMGGVHRVRAAADPDGRLHAGPCRFGGRPRRGRHRRRPTGLWRGIKWVDGAHEFIQGPLGEVVSAWAVNRDGTVIAGSGCTVDLPNQPPTGWSWTATGGVECHTAVPPRWVPWIFGNSNNYNTYIRAVSDDGRVMGGDIEFDTAAGDEESVIWFDGEPVYLRDYLRDQRLSGRVRGPREHGQDHRGVSRRAGARRPQRRPPRCREPLRLHRHPSGAGREVKRLLAFLSVLAAAPAFSQGLEVAALGGYTTAGSLEHDARTVEDLKLKGSFTWGASVGFFFSPRLGVEASWARQESGLELTTAEASAEMFDVTIDQIQGSFVYQFGGAGARWRPFLCAGAGAAIFSSTDITSETKLALNAGAGLKWLPSKRLGARLSARYVPTYLNDASSDFCDPFGFCQDWLHPVRADRGSGRPLLTT